MKTDLDISAFLLATGKIVRGYVKVPLLLSFLICMQAIAFAKINCSTAVTTQETNECAQIKLQVVEKKLDETYRRVLKSLDSPNEGSELFTQIKKRLVEAQKSWVVFRDKDCEAFFTLHVGGTDRTAIYLACMRRHAENRIKDLSEYEMQ